LVRVRDDAVNPDDARRIESSATVALAFEGRFSRSRRSGIFAANISPVLHRRSDPGEQL
jgi:hypothetical protein